ncbi:NLP/P60 protein [Actinobaculum suis]|uniref:NLP/P60 protein n=1 Tax=Actinobaculum suis TaxID=1657 RepID=A0A7Z9C7W7_9ACTO|nr:CHAP domain-containing protein [Actinobaculum suis]VDG75782.1 NLP/P60 protein [Actinobaculum suis]
MSRFRRYGDEPLVKPHLRASVPLTRGRTILGETGREERKLVVAGRPGHARVGVRRLGAGTKIAGVGLRNVSQAAHSEDAGQTIEEMTKGKASSFLTRRLPDLRRRAGIGGHRLGVRAGGRAVGAFRAAGVASRETAGVAVRESLGGARVAGMVGGRLRGAGAAGRQTMHVAGRQSAQGVRAAGQMAARLAQVVARRLASFAAGVAAKLAVPWLALAALFAIPIVVVVSFIPSWVANFFDDVSPRTLGFSMGDDYPWASLVRGGDGNALPAYNTVNPHTNYYYGNCTDFVFWRVNRDMGGTVDHWVYTRMDLTPLGGNGRQWGKPGNLPGWTTVTRPEDARQGDIVSFETGAFGHDSPFGHVAYVATVNERGDIVTENYGLAKYYVETLDNAQARKLMDSGALVIKRNPALQGRVEAAGSGIASGVLARAASNIGTPYGGGSPPGHFDCCGLVKDAFLYGAGIQLPMSVPGNGWATSKCEYAMYSLAPSYGGTYVPLAQAQPGDIVFFQEVGVSKAYDNLTHVAIYAGNGQVIDAIPAGGVGVRALSWYSKTEAVEPMVVRVGGK